MIRKKTTSRTNYEANSKLNNYKLLRRVVNQDLNSHEEKNNTYNEKDNIAPNSYTKYGTWSDRIGVFVNIVMVFFTLALFRQAVRQNTIAEKNIALADSVFKLSKKQFDSSIASGKESSENSRQNFLLQKKSVNAQIQALKQSQKEFEIENRPYIAITNINIDTSFTNNVVPCSWDFVNTGRFPGKVLNISSQIGFGWDTASKDITKTYISSENVNQNLSGDIRLPWKMNIYFIKATADIYKIAIKKAKMNVYFIGEFDYYSPAFKTYYKNKFVIQINYSEYMRISYLVNDDYEYKRP